MAVAQKRKPIPTENKKSDNDIGAYRKPNNIVLVHCAIDNELCAWMRIVHVH